jgi:hypothetical protein
MTTTTTIAPGPKKRTRTRRIPVTITMEAEFVDALDAAAGRFDLSRDVVVERLVELVRAAIISSLSFTPADADDETRRRDLDQVCMRMGLLTLCRCFREPNLRVIQGGAGGAA